MVLNKLLIKNNFNFGRKSSISFIVIHDTANPRAGADAMAHFRYFNSKYRGASAHYFVDSKGIVQVVEDMNTAWHCGDGKGRYGVTNNNSIGIEMCINSDGDFNMTMEHTAELVRFLMDFYGIDKSRVIRHFDASRKICPRSMSNNNWELWNFFKNSVL